MLVIVKTTKHITVTNIHRIIYTEIFLYRAFGPVLTLIIIITFYEIVLSYVEIIILIKNKGFTILMKIYQNVKKVKVGICTEKLLHSG